MYVNEFEWSGFLKTAIYITYGSAGGLDCDGKACFWENHVCKDVEKKGVTLMFNLG